MKNYNIITFLLLLATFTSFAQRGKSRADFEQKKEQIKSLKIAYITEELKLSSTEAEKFWPIYNTFEAKQSELRRNKLKDYYKKGESDDAISEQEASKLISQMESSEEELYQLRKKFTSNLKTILPAVKILKLKKAEDEFSRKLLQQYRDKKDKR